VASHPRRSNKRDRKLSPSQVVSAALSALCASALSFSSLDEPHDEFCFSSESNKLCCIGAARMKQSTVSRRT
jgi:hypothetical protein